MVVTLQRKRAPVNGRKTWKNICQVTTHTVTSLLRRNEEEAPITTAAPYATDNILTQSQNTYQECHITCQATSLMFFHIASNGFNWDGVSGKGRDF